MKQAILLLILIVFTASYGQSQAPDVRLNEKQEYRCDAKAGECSIQGTSTLHDWESDVEEFSIVALRDGDSISAEFNVIVNSIKSGHSGMDKNTYNALKSDEYPEIKFAANNLKIEGNSVIIGTGNLSIAGHTKSIPVRFNMASWVEETMTISGEIEIKMTEFGVDPPVALFGTVKTGDDIVFVINTTLKRVNN
jgi:hypothetical protein